MAKIESEGLTLEIKNIIQYDLDYAENVYEDFEISLMIRDKNVFDKDILRESYELCSGNISYLRYGIEEVLKKVERNFELEFTEPNFSFEIKCRVDIENDDISQFMFPESFKESLYEFVIWVSSGNWNGIYSDTSVGGKFLVRESVLKEFLRQLEQEYEQRKIEKY